MVRCVLDLLLLSFTGLRIIDLGVYSTAIFEKDVKRVASLFWGTWNISRMKPHKAFFPKGEGREVGKFGLRGNA